jgi:hypothetical protein
LPDCTVTWSSGLGNDSLACVIGPEFVHRPGETVVHGCCTTVPLTVMALHEAGWSGDAIQ